jgi:hypothetical protein
MLYQASGYSYHTYTWKWLPVSLQTLVPPGVVQSLCHCVFSRALIGPDPCILGVWAVQFLLQISSASPWTKSICPENGGTKFLGIMPFSSFHLFGILVSITSHVHCTNKCFVTSAVYTSRGVRCRRCMALSKLQPQAGSGEEARTVVVTGYSGHSSQAV